MVKREIRKQQITARRQEQILKAALEVFSRKGYSAATIPEIASLAGVAAGTIYIYYSGKRELFISAIETLMVTPLKTIFEKGLEKNFSASLLDALQDRLRIMQGGLMPRLISLMGEIQRDSELRAMFAEKLLHPLFSQMESMYCARMEAGEFRQMDPAITVRLVASMMIGLNLMKMADDASPLNRMSQEQLAAEIMNFIVYGVLLKEQPGGKPGKQSNPGISDTKTSG